MNAARDAAHSGDSSVILRLRPSLLRSPHPAGRFLGGKEVAQTPSDIRWSRLRQLTLCRRHNDGLAHGMSWLLLEEYSHAFNVLSAEEPVLLFILVDISGRSGRQGVVLPMSEDGRPIVADAQSGPSPRCWILSPKVLVTANSCGISSMTSRAETCSTPSRTAIKTWTSPAPSMPGARKPRTTSAGSLAQPSMPCRPAVRASSCSKPHSLTSCSERPDRWPASAPRSDRPGWAARHRSSPRPIRHRTPSRC